MNAEAIIEHREQCYQEAQQLSNVLAQLGLIEESLRARVLSIYVRSYPGLEQMFELQKLAVAGLQRMNRMLEGVGEALGKG